MDLSYSALMSSQTRSWYAYRMPYSDVVYYGDGIAVSGLHPGFVVAPFDIDKNRDSLFTIVSEESLLDNKSGYSQHISPLTFPDRSTTREEHCREVERIRSVIKGIGYGKIIAARTLLIEKRLEIADLFKELLESYRNAYVFACYTPSTGTLFGATPECLLSSENMELKTMALAGTRPSGDTDKPWDAKNIEEQRMVTQFIIDTFKNHSLSPVCEDTYTKNAGSIEHICTPIHACITEQTFHSNAELRDFLSELSPTPALSGLPRESAMRTIYECEAFDRGYYGGFVGCYESPLKFDFFVNLRSGRYTDGIVALFAGGGITGLSDPLSEWSETESKLSTLRRYL